jgi:hypothetical protein
MGSWLGREAGGCPLADPHILFRLYLWCCSDGAGHTRFVVRGSSGASAATLLEQTTQEAVAASRAGGLPAATVEVVGGGIMEW